MNELPFTNEELEDFIKNFNEINDSKYYKIENPKKTRRTIESLVIKVEIPNLGKYNLIIKKKRTSGYFVMVNSYITGKNNNYFSSTSNLKSAINLLFKLNDKYLKTEHKVIFDLLQKMESIRNF